MDSRDVRTTEQKAHNQHLIKQQYGPFGECAAYLYVYYEDKSVRVISNSGEYVVGIAKNFIELKEPRNGIPLQHHEPELNAGLLYQNGGDQKVFHSTAKPWAIQIVFTPSVARDTIKTQITDIVGMQSSLQTTRPWVANGILFRKIFVCEKFVGWTYFHKLHHECNTFSISLSGVKKNCSSWNAGGHSNVMTVLQTIAMGQHFDYRFKCEEEMINNYIAPNYIPYQDVAGTEHGIPICSGDRTCE
nr:MAG: hypothetical protein [Cypovirus sp.]